MTQIILPRIDTGIDWGAKRRLIVRTQDGGKLLFIVPGYKMSMGMRGMGRDYVPAQLVIHAKHGGGQHGRWKQIDKGRISNNSLRIYHTEIDAFFGQQVVNRIDLRRSYEISRDGAIREITD